MLAYSYFKPPSERSNFSKMIDHFRQNSKISKISGHSAKVHTVAWNCDGRRLASGSFDKTASVFSLKDDTLFKDSTLKGHSESVDQLCWHPKNPDIFVTASCDKTVRFWDARMSKCVSVVSTKGENINIAWSPDGSTLAVGNKDDLVTFLDAKTYTIKTEKQYKFEVNELGWNCSNDLFFITTGLGRIYVSNWPELSSQHTLVAHPLNVICLKFSSNGQYFAVGSADALVSIWDAQELCCLRTVSRLEWPVRSISFSHDSSMVASASEDLSIDISDVESGRLIHQVNCGFPTFTVAWHPKKYLLACACDEKINAERDSGTIQLFGLPS